MKKKIPGIAVIILACLVASTNTTAGGALFIIGVVMLVLSGRKAKKAKRNPVPTVPGPSSYKFEVITKSKNELMKLRTRNPNYDNPRNNGRPVYEYRFFDEACELVQTEKSLNVMYDGALIGYVPAQEAALIKGYLDHLIDAPRLIIYGGGVKRCVDGKWSEEGMAVRAEVKIQFMVE